MPHSPQLLAAEAAFFSSDNQQRAQQEGDAEIRRSQQTDSQPHPLNTGKTALAPSPAMGVRCEGRISVLKRGHGLARADTKRCMKRWVRTADNLIQSARLRPTSH